MPTKRAVLDQLTRAELQEAATRYEIEVPDRRVKDQLVEGLASLGKPRSR
jgi:hypothetical protein